MSQVKMLQACRQAGKIDSANISFLSTIYVSFEKIDKL